MSETLHHSPYTQVKIAYDFIINGSIKDEKNNGHFIFFIQNEPIVFQDPKQISFHETDTLGY